MIGIPLSYDVIDKTSPKELLEVAYANPQDPRSSRALELVL